MGKPSKLIEVELREEPLRLFRITRRDYYRMAEAGVFVGRPRVELVDGVLIEMPPQNHPHALAQCVLTDLLKKLYEPGVKHYVRMGLPFHTDTASAPEPDVAVVPGKIRDYSDHPDRAVLIVEVADSSLRFDLTTKARLYAKASVPVYWVIDVNGRCAVVHTEPSRNGYRSVVTVSESGKLELPGLKATIKVKELFL